MVWKILFLQHLCSIYGGGPWNSSGFIYLGKVMIRSHDNNKQHVNEIVGVFTMFALNDFGSTLLLKLVLYGQITLQYLNCGMALTSTTSTTSGYFTSFFYLQSTTSSVFSLRGGISTAFRYVMVPTDHQLIFLVLICLCMVCRETSCLMKA
jgi:hypothetical protein